MMGLKDSLGRLTFSVPACSNCGSAILPWMRGVHATQATPFCQRCSDAAIVHTAQAQPCFERAISWFKRNRMSFKNLNLKVEFRNRTQLNELSPTPNCLGVTLRTQNGDR